MSKKEKEVVLEGLEYSQKFVSDMKKNYGNIFKKGSEYLESIKDKQIIPISPAHDANLGGGLKEGYCAIFAGMPKMGKTSTCLQILANAQQPENGSRNCIYIDVECRLKDTNLKGIHGLNINKLEVIRPEGRVIAGEDYLDLIEEIAKNNERLVIVVDSISDFISRKEAEEGANCEARNKMPKGLKTWFKKFSPIVDNNNHIVIFIGQMIADMSRSMKTRGMDGGNAVQFKSDTTLEITHKTPWVEEDKIVGQFIHWKVHCSSCGGFPDTKYTSALRYGYGIDDIYELVDAAMELGLITKGGSWFSSDYWEDKIQGQAKLTTFLRENPKIVEEIKKGLTELC